MAVEDKFYETILKKKSGVSEYALRIACIVGCLLLLNLVWIMGDYFMYVLVIEFFAIYGTVYVFRNTSVEFEYSYLNGSFDVDRIMGKNKRKPEFSFDMKNVELVAHEDSPRIDHYINNPSFKIKDLSSGYYSENRYLVVFATRPEGGPSGVLIEPPEELLGMLKHDAPARVYPKDMLQG